jgi:hypothetical protein
MGKCRQGIGLLARPTAVLHGAYAQAHDAARTAPRRSSVRLASSASSPAYAASRRHSHRRWPLPPTLQAPARASTARLRVQRGAVCAVQLLY